MDAATVAALVAVPPALVWVMFRLLHPRRRR